MSLVRIKIDCLIWQVYHVANMKDAVLSGTGEAGISNYLHNKNFEESELPLKLATVSRCYRPEKTKNLNDAHLYRFAYIKFLVCQFFLQ